MHQVTKVYELQHSCGWGPYGSKFYIHFKDAKKEAVQFFKELRKKKSYVKSSLKVVSPGENIYNGQRKTIERWVWVMCKESNNESGQEFWDEDEQLELNEITLM